MKHLFTPLLPRDPLLGPVLVLAAHPDDEVIGAGGMLAWHARRGQAITVVHATDGAKGDPSARENDICAVRRREGKEALQRLGIGEPQHWDLPDGDLPEHLPALTERVRALFVQVQPRTLYSFWFGEAHRDHRAVAAATVRAAGALPADCRCLLYGVNHVVPGGTLFDTTDTYPAKYKALQAYASQNVYIDLPGMSEHRDRAATVNLDLAGVLYGEMFADLKPAELPHAFALADQLQRLLLRDSS
ncbi:MAG: PIG-L family deacetylase [Planctomycetes bacterium]|nr:PIG-L family deacetylase [Planctomycetota bacterium]